MQAIRVRAFGGPEAMRLEDAPDPVPGPGQVRVRIRAAGVNPVDVYIRSGTYARAPSLPYTPGFDGAGTVDAVGERVRRWVSGQRVYVTGSVTGTYAKFALCRENDVFPLPDRITEQQGAALGVPYATAHRALFGRAQARPGETVLVHGATGGVGIAAVQMARAAGLTVIGTGGTEEGRRQSASEGAGHVLDHKEPGYLDRALALTGGRGFDVIVEMLANANLGTDLKVLAPGGRVVVVGSRGEVSVDPRDLMARDAAVLGMSLFNVSTDDKAAIHAELAAGLADGTLRPLVGTQLPLAEAPKAHEIAMQPGAFGKIVLIP